MAATGMLAELEILDYEHGSLVLPRFVDCA